MRLKLTRVVAATLVVAIVAVVAPAAWLCGTESGLRWLVGVAARAPGVALATRGVRGTLVGGFAIDELVIDQERVRVVAHGLTARLDPVGLPMLRLSLPSLAAHDVAVAVRPALRPPDHAPVAFLPGPLRIAVDRLAVDELEIRAPAGGETRLAGITARVELARSRIVAGQLHADGGIYVVDGRATLLAGDPLGLDAEVTFAAMAGERRLRGSATAAGTLASLAVKAKATEPRGASFAGTVALIDTPQLVSRIVLEHFDPAALGLATGEITGAIDVAGSAQEFTIDGRFDAARVPLGPVTMALAGGYERDTLRLKRLTVSAQTTAGNAPARVTAAGLIDLSARPRVELQGDWAGLRWPVAVGTALLTSPRGTFRIAGGGPFDYEMSAALAGAQLPATTLAARGTVDGTRLAVASFDAKLATGRATGSATLAFTAPHRWQLAVSGRGIDPGAFRRPLKGRVNFDVRAEGEGFEPFGHWDARLEHLDGAVRGMAAHGGGAIRVRGTALAADHLKLAFGSATLDADGALGAGADFRWRLSVDRCGDFVDGATGRFRSQGALSGDVAHLALKATLDGGDLGLGDWRASQLTAEADVDATDRERSFLRLVARDVGHGTRRAGQLHVLLDGRAGEHTLAVRLINGADSAELATRGAYRNGVWTLRIESLRVSGPPLLAYRLDEPATLELSREAVSLTKSCFVREESRVCAQGGWSSARPWTATLDAVALPLRLTGVDMPKDMAVGGLLSAHIDAHGTPGQAWTGAGTLELADADFRYRAPNGRLEQIRVDRGSAKITADPLAFGAAVDLATVGGSTATASVRVARGDEPLAQSPLSGTLSLSTTELGALPVFIPGVDRLAGRVEAELRLAGTPTAPLVAGTARMLGGEIDIQRTNLLLRSVEAQLAVDGDQLTLSASAATRGGSASAAGRIRWHDRSPAGELEFKGERLLVADLPEAKVVASPQLRFVVDRNRITVRGQVTIPMAHIAPRDLRGAVIASGDERIVAEEATPRSGALALDAEVRLVLGDDVTIDAYGLKGRLGGSLLVAAHGGEPAYGSGELNVRDGTYTAYKRQLDIERGRLLFAGQSLGDPGIDVRAQRRIDTTIAGVSVRGTLLAPQISFYSDPPMSQAQISSMLILGTTFDEMQDRSKTAGSGPSSVSIGGFLSPRLYVSYGVSLTEAVNTLKLRYTIGDRWVIRTESGVQQSVDIEYTIGR